MKAKYLLIPFVIGFILAGHPGYAQVNPKIASVINQFTSQLAVDVQNDNLHGSISVAIIKNNQIIWSGALGYARKDKDIIADTNSIYRIGSITKTFTATLLMQLVEEGKIRLDDVVENYLPEIKNLKGYADAGKITFRQLASHTAGLKREPDISGGYIGHLENWESKLISIIPYCSFNSKPGQEFLYSNVGVAILGLALSRVTGVPYMQMVQQRILTQLHMNDTFFALPNDKRARLAEGMENTEKNNNVNTLEPFLEIRGRGFHVPSGGIYSTPRDLSKFVMSLMNIHPLLTAKSLKQMQEIPAGGKSYGLGLHIINTRKLDMIGHDGSVAGYTTQFLIDQSTGYAVILMRNYNFGSAKLGRVSIDLLKALKQAD